MLLARMYDSSIPHITKLRVEKGTAMNLMLEESVSTARNKARFQSANSIGWL